MTDSVYDSLPTAPDGDLVIWRYLPQEHFLPMFERFSDQADWVEPKGDKTVYCNSPGQLWFSYPSTFEDHFEGQFPRFNEEPEEFCDRSAKRLGYSEEEAARRKERILNSNFDVIQQNILAVAQLTGACCWTTQCPSGPGLWDYGGGGDCVAIGSTVDGVLNSIVEVLGTPLKKAATVRSPSCSRVSYIDHHDTFVPYDGARFLLGLLRTDLNYEEEVRVLTDSPLLARIPRQNKIELDLPPEAPLELSEDDLFQAIMDHQETLLPQYAEAEAKKGDAEGFYVPVDLPTLLDEIVFSKNCSSDFVKAVNELISKRGLTDTVKVSSKGSDQKNEPDVDP